MLDHEASSGVYDYFTRGEWKAFRSRDIHHLDEKQLAALRGVNEPVSLADVDEVYLPLARLIILSLQQQAGFYAARGKFLQRKVKKNPYVIGLAGSVAVGKSTTARLLQAILTQTYGLSVEIVATDGFLMNKEELEAGQLMSRKGFPESYHLDALLNFLTQLKAGEPFLSVPVYSHSLYDIVPNELQRVDCPDCVILEGLNILQTGPVGGRTVPAFVSDFLDFSVFVHADEENIRQWFVDRVLQFAASSFTNKDAYFHFLTEMPESEVRSFAQNTWDSINGVNLKDNILPFKDRADCILNKAADHSVCSVQLRVF